MAYMNQECKAKIKANLDAALKGTGVKYSLRCDNLSITCTIKSAPVDFIANGNETCNADFYQVSRGFKPNNTGYEQVNRYYYQDHYSGKAKELMTKIISAIYSGDYYDRSDSSTDYFDTAYYAYINIGKWDKPFVVTA
jgi:hypothetical protein